MKQLQHLITCTGEVFNVCSRWTGACVLTKIETTHALRLTANKCPAIEWT